MTFAFRIRFRVLEGQRLEHDEPEFVLREGPERRVVIRPLVAESTIKDALEFALRGSNYSTAKDAAEDGERWIGAMVIGFMAEFLPADFEIRGPKSGFYQGMLDSMSAEQGVAAYNDDPGLLVVPEDPVPVFGRLRADVIAGRNAEGTRTAILDAYEAELSPDDQTLLAFEMFSASQNMPPGDADSRFLMLMIAVESLIEPGDRAASQIAILEELREHLKSIEGISADDANAIRGALGLLKDESIGSAGRRLANSLGDRIYLDLSPAKFFTKCYAVRSQLVHGNVERSDSELIRSLIRPLHWFVRDLLRNRAGATWPHPGE